MGKQNNNSRRFNDTAKRVKSFLNNFDKKLMDRLNAIKSTFIGSTTLKIISEIFLALLIVIAIYLSQSIYAKSQRVDKENYGYRNITIGVNGAYIDSLFGIPKISFIETSTGFENRFYVLKDSVLRVVCDLDGSVIAYFITINKKGRTIDLTPHHPVQGFILGKSDFASLPDTPKEVLFNCAASGGSYNYYYETMYYGRPGRFNTYFYAMLSYGVPLSKNSTELFSKALALYFHKDEVTFENVQKYRNGAIPDTFGVISAGYEEDIWIIPLSENWQNVYNILSVNID